ncbi:aspartyl/asparaginyl beta-hydroxylase domain-containing protein [Sorangium sp. So ce542]|uniref:aspartyl/asparaginyl beta-hydroxylase domain-containing protein n=1 Tax=Sorangium sp. So ce542 TaxID=3133316 RepID=UPI003F647EEB
MITTAAPLTTPARDESASELDPWPLSPILAVLPATARLSLGFDVERMLADVSALRAKEWSKPTILTGEGVSRGADVDWRKLPLRSIGGDPDRTDPGGPSLEEFADTPWLREAPYLAELLASIPAPLRCVRLQSLGPGAASPVHNDTKHSLPWGIVRLHVPIVTTPGAILTIQEETHRWPPGELWYADFTRPHVVRNSDPVTRIHLVIDCQPTRELLALFPPAFQTSAALANTLFAAPVVPLSLAERDACRCSFQMPSSFPSFEEPDGAFLTAPRARRATIDVRGDRLVLLLDGEPAFSLVHVGDGEFRFAGWTLERTVQVAVDARRAPTVTLRSRVGDQTRALELPAERVRPS